MSEPQAPVHQPLHLVVTTQVRAGYSNIDIRFATNPDIADPAITEHLQDKFGDAGCMLAQILQQACLSSNPAEIEQRMDLLTSTLGSLLDDSAPMAIEHRPKWDSGEVLQPNPPAKIVPFRRPRP